MRIFLSLVRRVPDRPSPLLVEVADRLRARGHLVEQQVAEDAVVDVNGLVPEHDLYVLKSHTEMALSLAAALHAQGARMLNPYQACAAAQDKVLANRRLAAAGVPVPRTFLTGDRDGVASVLLDGPVIVKPLRGHRGVGVELLRTEADLARLPAGHGPLLVQDFVPGPGEDLKVYVVGEQVWAVRKPFSPSSFTVPGVPVAVTPRVEEIALATGAATGLGLFGLDVIEGPDGPVVVDLNYFPGYKGCVGVAGPMADYIDEYASGNRELRLPPLMPPRPKSCAAPALGRTG